MSTAAVVTVTGTASIRDRADLSGGESGDAAGAGVLSVKLVSVDGDVLAGQAVPTGDGPTPFELTVDAAVAPSAKKLRLWAMLRTDVGVWGTPELVTLRDELVLSRVDT